MKTRTSFVANSSSSSFIIISGGDKVIFEGGYYEETDSETEISKDINIDKLISDLTELKNAGVKKINIKSGTSYC